MRWSSHGEHLRRPTLRRLMTTGVVAEASRVVAMTADGPRVLEFNTRFGDPETQALLPRWEDDALEVLTAAAEGGLEDGPVRGQRRRRRRRGAGRGRLPGHAARGRPIAGLDEAAATGAEVYHAGTAPGPGGTIVTAGGRVLAVSARGDGVAEARERAYAAAELVRFEGRQMRRDIAAGMEAEVEGGDPALLAPGDGRDLDRGGQARPLARGGAGRLPRVGGARASSRPRTWPTSRAAPASRSSAPRSSRGPPTTTWSPSSPTSPSAWARPRAGSTTA